MLLQFIDYESISLFSVVPVFVNTGAALLPAILAGLASVLGLLFKPHELFRLCVRKPWVPVLVAAIATGGYFGIPPLMDMFAPTAEADATSDESEVDRQRQSSDWADVALERIRQEERDANSKWIGERDRRLELEQRVSQLEGKIAALADSADSTASEVPVSQDSPLVEDAKPQAAIYRGDASRCGYGGGGSPLKLGPFWQFNEPFTMYLSSPIVVGSAVYGASCTLDPPSNYGAIFRIDAKTGEEIWYADIFDHPKTGREVELKAFFSSPAVTADGKYLVIGQGLHLDDDCDLVCLDTESGEVRWTVPTPLHIEGSPAIEGDIVVAGAGAVEDEDMKPKGDPGFVFGVRISDGELLWKYPIADPESSPVVRDGIAYIGSGVGGNAVVALRTESDEELEAAGLDRLLWKAETPYAAVGAITVIDDLVLIGCGNANYVFMPSDPKGVVLALDRKTGDVRWRADVSNSVLGAIAVRDGRAICPVLDGEIVALDMKKDGEILWSKKIRERSLLKASPAVTDSHVYALTHDGYLYVLDVEDGEIVEHHYVNSAGKPGEMGLTTGSPFVAGGRVYLGTETGGLRCFVGEEVR